MLSTARMSCAVMRILLPEVRTLPSRTWATLRRLAISAMSIFSSLKANEDVRAITFRSGAFASRFRSSSAMPSDMYS